MTKRSYPWSRKTLDVCRNFFCLMLVHSTLKHMVQASNITHLPIGFYVLEIENNCTIRVNFDHELHSNEHVPNHHLISRSNKRCRCAAGHRKFTKPWVKVELQNLTIALYTYVIYCSIYLFCVWAYSLELSDNLGHPAVTTDSFRTPFEDVKYQHI